MNFFACPTRRSRVIVDEMSLLECIRAGTVFATMIRRREDLLSENQIRRNEATGSGIANLNHNRWYDLPKLGNIIPLTHASACIGMLMIWPPEAPMAQPDFYFNPFDADFRANPYPHFPALLDGPPRQLKLFMPTTLIARYDDVVTCCTITSASPFGVRKFHFASGSIRSAARPRFSPRILRCIRACDGWSAKPSLRDACASSSRGFAR